MRGVYMATLIELGIRLTGFVPSVLILIACLRVFRRIRTEGTILLLVGSIAGTVTSLVYIALFIMAATRLFGSVSFSHIHVVLRFIAVPASCIFAFGFLRIARHMQ